MERIKEYINEVSITRDGLTRGETHCHQRRKGSLVMYDTWLIQGPDENDTTDFFIAENELDGVINYLVACKKEIANHRLKAKALGHIVTGDSNVPV